MGLDELNSFADSITPSNTRYRSSMNYAADTEPDAHADLLKQSKALDVPPSLMPKKKGDQRRLAMSRDLDLLELPKRAPKTAEWFGNPDNAMVAHDDHQALSGIEQWFTEYAKKPAARFLTGIGMGADMLALPFVGEKNREALMKRIEVMRKYQQENAADPATSFGGRLAQSLEELAPYLLMGPGGVPLLVSSATAGKGIELQDRGVTGPTQSALSALSGLTAFGMTKIPMAQGSYLKSAAAGAGGNIALGVAERTIEKGILSATGFDKQAEETKILDPDTIASDIAMGILFGAHARHGQAKAEKQAATILAFADLVNKSKFKERYKPGFMDFIKQQAEGGELETIGMPVEKFEEFWQSTKKPLTDLLTDPNAYHEAKVTGGDVVIPIEDFSANFAEHVNSMEHVMDLRLRPGDDTLREAQEAAKTEEKDIQEFLKSAQESEGEPVKSSEQRVYDDVLGQLLGLNVPREVAEKQAALWAIRQRTRAERVGGDAWDLYSEIPLEITRPLPEALKRKTIDTSLDPILDRLRAGNIPSESQQFGPSLVEFLREKGLVDAGGELAAMDVDKGLKPFQKKLVRKGGLELDKAREAAVEAGYLPEGSDVRAFLDAIDSDMRGGKQYSKLFDAGKSADEALTLNQMKEYLERAGIDLEKMNNEEVRQALQKMQPELFQGETVDQLRPAVKIGNEILEGEQNQKHDDVLTDYGRTLSDGERGFIGKDGKFMTREQAKAWVEKNQPEVFKRLPEGEMHSEPYAEAVKGAKELYQQLPVTHPHHPLNPDMPGNLSGTSNYTRRLTNSFIGYRDTRLKAAGFDTDTVVHSAPDNPKEVMIKTAVSKDGKPIAILNRLIMGNHLHLDEIRSHDPSVSTGLLRPLYKAESDIAKRYGLTVTSDLINLEPGKTLDKFKEFYPTFKTKGDYFHVAEHTKPTEEPAHYTADVLTRAYANRGKELPGERLLYRYATDTARGLEEIQRTGREVGPSVELFQPGDLSDKRGFIRIGQDKIQIGLLEKADLSTFVHESSHAWTEEFARDVKREKAPEELKADWEKLKQWAGFEGDDITVEAHEKIASGFEEYLKEGKAPSQDLMPLFQRFSAWIKQVYRKLTGTGVTLTDDVRGVFDRMLATDAEIARAEDIQNLRPLFTDAKTAGMTEAEFAPYKKIAEKAHEENKNRLLVKMMDEMNREQKAWWKSEKETMRGAVTEEAQNNPVYQAFQFFAKGESWDGVKVDEPMKLSRYDLVKMYGEDFVKKLPRAFQRLYTREGGVHPDVAADMFGFGSGDEMIRKLAEAPKMEQWIAAETDVRMREKYGDMMQDGSITEEALKSIHGDETGQLLRAELRAIRRMQGTVKEFTKGKEAEQRERSKSERDQFKKSIPPLKWFQAMAAQHIDTKSIRELKPGTYLRAEAKAAREAEEALDKQDFAKASEAKQRQLTNHYLYLEATKSMEDIDRKVMPYMKKMETKARLGTIGKAGGDYLDQIQGILSRYEFSKIPYSDLDAERSLREYLDKFKEDYDREIPIDGRILDESRKANYREVPLNELFAAHDAVKAIEHAAKEVVKVQKEGQSVMMEDAREELISKLSDTHPEVKDLVTDPQLQNKFQKGFRTLKKLNADMTRIEFLVERMDGGKQGPWHDYFWNRYLNAETRKLELLDLIHEPLKKLVDDMPAEQRERLASREPIHIKTMGEAFSRQRLFSILMNLGNESNRDKLMRGGIIQGEGNKEFSQEAIDEIMGHFTKADFDMAQGLWDTVDKLLPEAKALHKRWTGLEFPEIERTPLKTPFGEYAGGYWPIKYDARASRAGEKQQAESAVKTVQDLFGFSSGKPSTSKGYTKERTQAAYPLMLDWKQIATRHINDVATDVAYREFVDQANRMLKHTDIKRQMQVRAGEFSNDIMQKWLRGMVGGDSWGQASHSAADEIYKAGYSHFTTAVLGLNIAGAMADIAAQQLGAFTRVRGDYMLKAYASFAMNPKKFAEFVEEKSTWRHHIEKQVDQSIQNSMDYLAAHPTKWNDLMRMTLSMRVWMYKITGNIAWTAAYNEAMEQGQVEKEAIRIADKVQRMTEHAGDVGSISAMERHPVWKKLLVYAGPMEVAYNAMMNNLIEIKNKKGAAPEAMGKFFVMWMAQSVIWAAVRGKKEEEESWAGFIARHAALGPFEAFPILRDLVPYAEKKMLGKHASTRGLAITAPFQATIDALSSDYRAATGEGEMSKAVKDTNIAAGMVLGYPSVQLDITGQYVYDVLTGQYSAKHPWSFVTDALWRRKKE